MTGLLVNSIGQPDSGWACSVLAITVALAIANTRHIVDLEYQATQDPMTGLPNRKFLHEKFTRHCPVSRGGPSDLALLVLDLNRFKDLRWNISDQEEPLRSEARWNHLSKALFRRSNSNPSALLRHLLREYPS
jgi:hypothetical protein